MRISNFVGFSDYNFDHKHIKNREILEAKQPTPIVRFNASIIRSAK